MILDAVKRLFGLSGSEPSSSQRNDNHPDSSVRVNDQLIPFSHIPHDVNEMESDMAQIHRFMEQQMRSMMGSFGFMFGSPFQGFGFEDDSHLRSFPFTPGIQGIPNNDDDSQLPRSGPPTVLDPRDEVLKPQFRSRSPAEWNGQDQILDERLSNEGVGSVIEDLRPSNELYGRNNVFGSFPSFFGNGAFGHDSFGAGLFGNIREPLSESTISSSTVTIYSNVNGHKSVEKIVRRPDGTIERTVIKDDGTPSLP